MTDLFFLRAIIFDFLKINFNNTMHEKGTFNGAAFVIRNARDALLAISSLVFLALQF